MNDTKQVDHYAVAERFLDEASAAGVDGRDATDAWFVDALTARAQVHATLALVAATNRVADDEDVIAGVIDGEQRTLRVAMKP